MKIKRSLSLMTVLTVILLLVASTAYAQRPERQRKRVRTKIGLTPDQREKIKNTRLDSEKEKIRLRADLKIARLELRSLMAEEELDRGDIYEKIEDMGELRTRLAKNKVDRRMALREILTKEQLEKLKDSKLRRLIGERRLKHRRPGRRGLAPRFPLLEEFWERGKMERLLPEAEEAPIIGPEGHLIETPELAKEVELVQLLDELELATLADLVEPVSLFEEVELLPLLEELPPLPEEPDITPLIEEDAINPPEK